MQQAELKPLTTIRGFAVIWVVFHHLMLLYRYPGLGPVSSVLFTGFMGVDIFFVLSGFILTLVYRDLTAAGLPDFARRRLLRIYPLHLAVLGVLALASLSPNLRPWFGAAWRDLPVVAVLAQPFLLDHASWNVPSWSAGIELACYCLFPAMLFAARRLPAVLLVALLVCAGYAEYHLQTLYRAYWLGLPSFWRGWADFCFGMTLGLLSGRFRLPARLDGAAEMLAAAAFIAVVLLRDFPLIPLAAGAAIWVLASSNGSIARIMRRGPLVFLGEISFSIYLIHLPIANWFNLQWPVHLHPPLTPGFAFREAVYFAVVIAVARQTYRFIETPARGWATRRRSNPQAPPIPQPLASG